MSRVHWAPQAGETACGLPVSDPLITSWHIHAAPDVVTCPECHSAVVAYLVWGPRSESLLAMTDNDLLLYLDALQTILDIDAQGSDLRGPELRALVAMTIAHARDALDAPEKPSHSPVSASEADAAPERPRGPRVALCGASGTGKTTLARILADTLRLPLNPVGSRSVARDMGFANPYDVDAAGKRVEFQTRLQLAKIEWERDHADGFVTDRTPLDDFAYAAIHGIEAIDADFIDRALAHLSTYDVIFMCPIEAFHHLGDDPARVKSAAYHWTYEAVLMGLLGKVDDTEPSIQVVWLFESDLASRVLFALPLVTAGPAYPG